MLLETQHISKKFNGIYALQDICFSLSAGEIHGLVGENGAGKSTLIKLLTGVYRIQEGTVLWDGQPVSIPSPQESRALGIHVVHQDRTLIAAFDCVENAYLGLPYPTRFGRVDWKAMRRRVQAVCDELDMELPLSKTAAELSPPQQTCLEIVRAMMTNCRALILDEPTAALTDREAERLFGLLNRLRDKGTAILYVSHRLDEIFRLTDRVTVLRNGTLAATVPTAELTRDALIALMSDHAAVQAAHRSRAFGAPLLEVRGLATKDGAVRSGSLTARSGEILGVFGLGGSGRTELLESIYGCRAVSGGTVTLDGEMQKNLTPHRALQRGMVLISEDRRGKAMVGSLSVEDNLLLSCMDDFSRFGVVDQRKARRAVEEKITALNIKLTGQNQRMLELSGGNQQKVVLSRALMTAPKVFLCDEPTQAVDVTTRSEIHHLLRQKADEGAAVVFVSSDLPELLEVADNIQIMSRGATRECLKNENLTAQQVLRCCYEEGKDNAP